MMEGKTVDMITFNRVGPEAVTNYHGFSSVFLNVHFLLYSHKDLT